MGLCDNFFGGRNTVWDGVAEPLKGEGTRRNRGRRKKPHDYQPKMAPCVPSLGCAPTGGDTSIEAASGAKSGYVTGLGVMLTFNKML